MKIIYDYRPTGSTDTVTINASTALTGFPASNLKEVGRPMWRYKSADITGDKYVEFVFSAAINPSLATFGIFLNRINFKRFEIQHKMNVGDSYTSLGTFDITDSKDEIYDEEYLHYILETSVSFKYLKLIVPSAGQTFVGDDITHVCIGNLMVGEIIDVWEPAQDFRRLYNPKLAITEFDSGWISVKKMSRTKRIFTFRYDKIAEAEVAKIRKTYEPFILWFAWDADPTTCYLVRTTKEIEWQMTNLNINTLPQEITEIV
jgi:hypothetical protein